jgi:riboflavin biosynthesis pyrimidine reductase
MDTILRLYPAPYEERPLEGTYLAHDLSGRGEDNAFVYTNFLSSLDGRISEVDPHSRRRRVPEAIANARDWRLYMELAAQAEVILTTARHLRAVAEGRQKGLLGFDRYPDLARWRSERGMPAEPALAAVSESLDIPVAGVRKHFGGPLYALVSASAADSKVQRLQEQGVRVLQAGTGPALDGRQMGRVLREQGWRQVYSIAGPRVAHALLAGGILKRLYLTLATMALGGREFDTLTLGHALSPPVRFTPAEIYLDRTAPPGAAQLFGAFDASG